MSWGAIGEWDAQPATSGGGDQWGASTAPAANNFGGFGDGAPASGGFGGFGEDTGAGGGGRVNSVGCFNVSEMSLEAPFRLERQYHPAFWSLLT